MIHTHYWNRIGNFGDVLVPVILEWISGKKVEWVPKEHKGKVLCIGSEMSRDVLRTGDVVWGYGTRHEEKIVPPPGVHFLAVRGPFTRSLIEAEVPEVYGDPGILMPLIYQPTVPEKKSHIGLVPHHAERHLFKEVPGVRMLDIAVKNVFRFIDELVSCEVIVTSSLHACIVAETYGIPVVWFLGQNDDSEGFKLKFNDYFLGTGRGRINPVVFREPTQGEIFFNLRKTLPKPVFNREGLLKAWKDFSSMNIGEIQ